MNVVIMGSGRVASELATLLDEEGHKVTVVGIQPSGFDNLRPSFGRGVVAEGRPPVCECVHRTDTG